MSHEDQDSFMTMRRSLWNSLGFFIGFVNMSARLSAERRAHVRHFELERLNHVAHEEVAPRCTCFIRSWCCGLYDTWRALWESVERDDGDGSAASRPTTSLRKYSS